MTDDKSDDKTSGSNLPANNPSAHISIPSVLEGIDTSNLTPQQKNELEATAAKDHIEFVKRARELGLDSQALHANLSTFSTSAREMAEHGVSTTITNTRDDGLGRTEIIVGNTEQAKRGKLSRSQIGDPDRTLLWMGFALVVLIVIAVVVTKSISA